MGNGEIGYLVGSMATPTVAREIQRFADLPSALAWCEGHPDEQPPRGFAVRPWVQRVEPDGRLTCLAACGEPLQKPAIGGGKQTREEMVLLRAWSDRRAAARAAAREAT